MSSHQSQTHLESESQSAQQLAEQSQTPQLGDHISENIDRAAERIGSVWPIHSFVTANPLSGFEDQPFHEAVAEAQRLFGGRGYPRPSVFQQAWETGQIDPEILANELESRGIDRKPETLLDELADAEAAHAADADIDPATETVDCVLSKWLAAFVDKGKAAWPMPDRDEGFYAAWRAVAPVDSDVPCSDSDALPETAPEALEDALSGSPESRWVDIVEHHLAALPGWTGLIKQRADDDADPWQTEYAITLREYLAVRLTLVELLDAPLEPDTTSSSADGTALETEPIAEIWLTAWERSYRERLLSDIDTSVTNPSQVNNNARPAAQLVFCIDTRSEIIRRHLEEQGHYETHGYAGFFGVPMRYQGYDSATETDACPPIVDAQHRIVDRPAETDDTAIASHERWTDLTTATRKHFKRLKTDVVAAFPFVEGAGGAYGSAMTTRTLFPSTVTKLRRAVDERIPSSGEFCSPTLEAHEHDDHTHADHALPQGMTFEEKVSAAETAFDLMGWTDFARLVVFTGHASHTTNNPFDSSLDCGACAGNAGGPNARVLATICNDENVKAELRERGFHIPEDTVFLAGEHNTTTDEITLFDGDVPESHQEDLEQLYADLERARAGAAAERLESMTDADADEIDPEAAVEEVERKAVDWAETRPEWGLAGNASFVIGPRELTEDENLDGRAFLHSYDWTTDPEGDALEAILTGPLVVTQWINSQYYFATVDNGVYGSGSKVTQNPVGNVGVVQGNGGDLMTGLPLQSLKVDDDQPYHQPLRLSTVIHAPLERVTDILNRHDEVTQLLDNDWIGGLTVIDPEQDNQAFHYQDGLEWEPEIGPAPAH
ncbi:DUF2309 domain-containing protein [Natronolimnobius sp. AArcel1]|uniref:DUF2309 domain-containing protein n=1 Tax=Natronolimnobius sp. AArcel1 TaxID=1679093 RepID=UPI0013EDDB5B|nr:DUF2309 domain-containing protein [Natronolimnobius sp. AArcel1]NGM68575.1 DUF2309 domain-containing protein [Natronolimnobius sp. AArcel1]